MPTMQVMTHRCIGGRWTVARLLPRSFARASPGAPLTSAYLLCRSFSSQAEVRQRKTDRNWDRFWKLLTLANPFIAAFLVVMGPQVPALLKQHQSDKQAEQQRRTQLKLDLEAAERLLLEARDAHFRAGPQSRVLVTLDYASTCTDRACDAIRRDGKAASAELARLGYDTGIVATLRDRIALHSAAAHLWWGDESRAFEALFKPWRSTGATADVLPLAQRQKMIEALLRYAADDSQLKTFWTVRAQANLARAHFNRGDDTSAREALVATICIADEWLRRRNGGTWLDDTSAEGRVVAGLREWTVARQGSPAKLLQPSESLLELVNLSEGEGKGQGSTVDRSLDSVRCMLQKRFLARTNLVLVACASTMQAPSVDDISQALDTGGVRVYRELDRYWAEKKGRARFSAAIGWGLTELLTTLPPSVACDDLLVLADELTFEAQSRARTQVLPESQACIATLARVRFLEVTGRPREALELLNRHVLERATRSMLQAKRNRAVDAPPRDARWQHCVLQTACRLRRRLWFAKQPKLEAEALAFADRLCLPEGGKAAAPAPSAATDEQVRELVRRTRQWRAAWWGDSESSKR